ncbi:MAG: hypothetical protein NZ928_03475 [Endomicrobia bacterium]|nr:hypothetical protein [Endomicrobiia bacterium]MCX7940537.1 hypothetical protein [Endomicrobiia bacterium]MDW8056022.1 hypothetical protein [Elusimicrobiota bacterium]
MKEKELDESFLVKIGTQELDLGEVPPMERLFKELVADYVSKKFNEKKEEHVDTMKSYAYTLLEIAEEKIGLEQKVEEKITNLELKISSLIERLNNYLAENDS